MFAFALVTNPVALGNIASLTWNDTRGVVSNLMRVDEIKLICGDVSLGVEVRGGLKY